MTETVPQRGDGAGEPTLADMASVAHDDEEAALVFALGMVVREAAALEYTLHGLLVHLAGKELAYEYKPAEMASTYIDKCTSRIEALSDDAPIPPWARKAILHDLALSKDRFAERNGYVHGCWTSVEETQSWAIIKGRRGSTRPEHKHLGRSDLWHLAFEFYRLNQKLIAWDIEYFGEAGDPELGQPERVSVKRISRRRP